MLKDLGGPLLAAIALGGGFLIYLDKQGLEGLEGLPRFGGSDHGWTVVPGSVYDGDTLRVRRGGEEKKIRLCGIDAPEEDQPGGLEARDRLREWLPDRQSVILVEADLDRYGRTVAEIFVRTDGGQEVHANSQLVREGLAWAYRDYLKNCPNAEAIALAEDQAREDRLGVWGDPEAITPWKWRRGER